MKIHDWASLVRTESEKNDIQIDRISENSGCH